MSRSILAGPLLLLLYQTAPITVAPDSSGVVRVSLGYGAGAYHSRVEQMSCETGEITTVSQMDGSWTSGTAEVEAWPGGGPIRATVVATQLRGSGVADRWTAGGLVAREWRQVGVGAGLVRAWGDDPFTRPLAYVRLGDLDERHFRVDVAVPEPPAPGRTWIRLAAGHNLGTQPGPRFMTGVALPWPGTEDDHRSAFLDVLLPLGEGAGPLELTFSGQFGFGDIYHESIGAEGTYSSWGFQAGLRYTFGQ